MLWKVVQKGAELYATGFVFALPLVMGICKSNSHLRDQEDFEPFDRWQAQNVQEKP